MDGIGKGSVVNDSLDQVSLGESSSSPQSSENGALVLGAYKNVHLTETAYAALKEQFPLTYNSLIENFSAKLYKYGYNYPNHYATILQWAKEDGAKQQETQSGSFETDEFFKVALARSEDEYKKYNKNNNQGG